MRKPQDVRPVSVSPSTAARMLDLHYDTVRDMIHRGVFTVLAPEGRGKGKRIYLPTAEVELYGSTRDEQAVRDFRAKNRQES